MLDLPKGPWRPVVTGNWDGIDISYYENPDHELAVFIFDNAEGKVKGIVLLLVRFFLAKGDANKLTEKFSEGNLVWLRKKAPNFKLDYLAVVTDPIYIKFEADEIVRKFRQSYNSLVSLSRELRKLAREHNLGVIELKNSNEEVVHRLFGEPLALPTVIIRKAGEGTTLEINKGKIRLGLKNTGEKVDNIIIQNLIFSIVIGLQRDRILQVLMEEAVLNGVTVVLFDEDGRFKHINKPNPSMHEFGKFELSQPMGMPTRIMEPGIEIFIELEHFDRDTLAEFLGITGSLADTLGEAIKKRPETLAELESILENQETKKYNHERALRVLKLLESTHGDLFSNKNDAREILAPWLKNMGRVTYIKLEGLPDGIKEGIKLSVTKAIDRFIKKEMPQRRELSSLSVVSAKEGKISEEYIKTLKVLTSYGHGILLAVDEKDKVSEEDLKNARFVAEAINENEVVVTVPGERPYRAKVRPTLAYPPSSTH